MECKGVETAEATGRAILTRFYEKLTHAIENDVKYREIQGVKDLSKEDVMSLQLQETSCQVAVDNKFILFSPPRNLPSLPSLSYIPSQPPPERNSRAHLHLLHEVFYSILYQTEERRVYHALHHVLLYP